jgi:hypothetical protein
MKNNRNFNQPILERVSIPGGAYEQMRVTLEHIGEAIVDGSRYLPIRNRAAALASTAPPKDYFGQAKAIYDDFVRRWRYVKDPFGRELIAKSPKQIFELVLGGRSKSPGVGLGYGAGDCDDATVGMGALLMSIGFPVRVCTIAPVGAPAGNSMSHVFCQAMIGGHGWVTADPVVWPKHGFGYLPPYSRLCIFDLAGVLMKKEGNVRGMSGHKEGNIMGTVQPLRNYQDFAGFGDVLDEGYELPDFRKVGIAGFGLYSESMGILDFGDQPMGLAAEVETDSRGLSWTPIIEISPADYRHMAQVGTPYHGMLGLGDNGLAYYWNQNLGFFKKLFRRVKKGIRKVGKKIRGVAKKILKKLPGGKYLLKLGKKVWAISKKLVKPLAKILGPLSKLATKLAPIAALVPGIGTAVAAAMATGGKIGTLLTTHGVKIVEKAGKVAKLAFKSGKAAAAFQESVKKLAKETKRQGLDKKLPELIRARKAVLDARKQRGGQRRRISARRRAA